MDLALRGQEETDTKWADANIGPLVPGGGNRAMGATGLNDGVGGVNGGQYPPGSILAHPTTKLSQLRRHLQEAHPSCGITCSPLDPRSACVYWASASQPHRICLPCLYPQHPGRGRTQSWLRGDLLT